MRLLAAQAEQGRPITVIEVADGENAYPGGKGLSAIRMREQGAGLADIIWAAREVSPPWADG